MDINNLIKQYGYITLLIGSMAEGETITIMGGIAAHHGLFRFPLVVATVAMGGMIGDQLLYLIGLRFSSLLQYRFVKHEKKINIARNLIQRHPWLFVIGTRFMYGFRIIGPLLIGSSKLSPKIFLPLNIVGAIIWALIFTTLGYLGDEVIRSWINSNSNHYNYKYWIWFILAIIAVILTRFWFKFRKKTKPTFWQK